MDRVKFYSLNDMTYGSNLKRCERVIKEYEKGKEAQDINDIIELYNIKKYFDNKIFLADWTKDDISRYQSTVNTFIEIVARFFKSFTDDNIIELYFDVDKFYYEDDFWEIIDKFRVYEKITEKTFKEMLNTSKISLHDLLKFKNITEYFGKIIRDYMLNNSSSAKLLLDKYELKHTREKDPIFFPKELSNSDKEAIINNYIDSENPNINYLRLIAKIQSNKDKIELTPKTLLKAKRKAKEIERKIFTGDSGMNMEIAVIFSESQSKEVVFNVDKFSITATYSTKWIEDNQDYPTLLNNFIYLFKFVDQQMRFTLVNKYNEMSIFEHLIPISQYAYTKGVAFDQKNILSLLQLQGYYNQVFSLGIRLEEVIEWFFHNYLEEEFNACNFRVTMPSAHSTFLEKCTTIMPAMESILKQFTLYVEEGNIDFELLDIRSEHLIYKNIPSLVKRKYVYGTGEKFKSVTNLLFSDQSYLCYHEKINKSYDNFFELIRNEKIKLNDYPEYAIQDIIWLIDNNFLSLDEEENLIFNDELLIAILYDLYFNEVISYWKYTERGKKILDDLEKENIVEFESSLFSRPEQDYINYTLNKSQFNNGLDLRNKYSHTQPKSGDDEKIHEQNYMLFLRLFILIVIKINDDFCTFFEMKN